jgi:predicted RNA-binding Zn-ribbon protein involved in translation (DUF1610 family)
MTQMPALQPLQCLKCQTPLPAEPDEVAWLCPSCGQAVLLDESQPAGLALLEMHFAAGIQNGQRGRPFWVAQGLVTVQRQTYSGDESRQALEFWKTPRTFFVPAYSCTLDELISLGMQLLKQPVSMMQAQSAAFLPVILSPQDVRPMAEFIIMGIEAERRDMIKSVNVQLNLAKPILWVLP